MTETLTILLVLIPMPMLLLLSILDVVKLSSGETRKQEKNLKHSLN